MSTLTAATSKEPHDSAWLEFYDATHQKSPSVPSTHSVTSTPPPSEEAVRLLAYRIYEDRKLKNLSGDHLSDWCAALEKLSSLRH
ncbi:MAG: hypothetical protein IT576_16735 [Verrucomicrobiales bacterium]|nr:hypothetical protein [Verrucomicrobiales bacterium]